MPALKAAELADCWAELKLAEALAVSMALPPALPAATSSDMALSPSRRTPGDESHMTMPSATTLRRLGGLPFDIDGSSAEIEEVDPRNAARLDGMPGDGGLPPARPGAGPNWMGPLDGVSTGSTGGGVVMVVSGFGGRAGMNSSGRSGNLGCCCWDCGGCRGQSGGGYGSVGRPKAGGRGEGRTVGVSTAPHACGDNGGGAGWVLVVAVVAGRNGASSRCIAGCGAEDGGRGERAGRRIGRRVGSGAERAGIGGVGARRLEEGRRGTEEKISSATASSTTPIELGRVERAGRERAHSIRRRRSASRAAS